MEYELSSDVKTRNLKILLWGSWASRKTETGLRYFPHPFLIDTEGNSDHCIGSPSIPPFLRKVTKDVYEVLEIMDAVAEGSIKYPDGSPVETLIIDSASILWSVRQEVGALNAERRALKKIAHGGAIDPDTVKMIQLDWVVAKRPLKRIHAHLNASGIKYVILTARDKDLYQEKSGDSSELIKVGVTRDAMRGTEFEVNIAFQMFNEMPWKCKVTKVHGEILGGMFPVGTELPVFPYKELLAYATGAGTTTVDETEQAEKDLAREAQRTQADLLTLGREKGLSAKEVAGKLKKAGFEKFDAEQWDEMVKAISVEEE